MSIGSVFRQNALLMKTMPFFAFALSLTALGAACSKNPSDSGQSSLSGMVTFEGQSDHSGITVFVQDLALQTTTSASGAYSFLAIPAGTYSLLAYDGDELRHLYDYATLQGVSIAPNQKAVAPAMELSLFQRVENDITGDVHWTAEQGPYLITRSVTLPSGAQLTIEPGCTVKFEDYYRMTIQGGLVARGTATDSILITGIKRDGAPGDWDRLSIQGPEDALPDTIAYCRIQYANIGLACSQASPVICDNSIDHCSGYGLVMTASTPEICRNHVWSNYGGISCETGCAGLVEGNCIEENASAGIACAGSDPQICDNTLVQNQRGLQIQSAADPLVWHNRFSENQDAIYLYYYCNPLIEANIISDQQRFGLHLQGYNRPEIHYNNIAQNGSYGIYLNDQKYDIPAECNWWGTSDISQIGDLLWDRHDDAQSGEVLISPVLSAPVDSAGPRNTL